MMHWLRVAIWRLLPCRHRDADGQSLMYRERRAISREGSLHAIHLVCSRCGYAKPMVDRSSQDQARVLALCAAAGPRQARKKTVRDDVEDQADARIYLIAESRKYVERTA